MKHTEYLKVVENADTAVLFIHGILGSPDRYKPFIEATPVSWTVHNILLDGHGGEMEDFAETSMIKWQTQMVSAIEKLKRNHKKILVVAHSLGTLLTIEAVTKNPDRICGMLLFAPPLDIWMKPSLAVTSAKIVLGKVDESNPAETSLRDANSINTKASPIDYVRTVPRFLELFKEAIDVRNMISKINVPTVAFISEKDELVPPTTKRHLTDNDSIRLVSLPNSMHEYYPPEDFAVCMAEFKAMCERI